MREIQTLEELRHQVTVARERGERIALVPTMGALHAGHEALLRVARAQCDFVVATVYVNPTQFAPGEDLDRYPRDPGGDADLAQSAGVDLLWRPTDATMYGERRPGSGLPAGPNHGTRVIVGDVGDRLCGENRPGHFDGVATVVVKLLGAATPDVLYLGEKDFQQSVVVRRVISDLLIPVDVRVVPTVRDPDGLALSSRNRYLSPPQRESALAIPRALDAAERALADGERSVGRLRARVEVALLEAADLTPQYVEFVHPETLETVDAIDEETMLLVAARVGSTRLIDNRRLVPAAADASASDPTADGDQHETAGAVPAPSTHARGARR